MALKVEGVVDDSVDAEEALGRSSRFEALDLALSSSHRLMRVLGPIIPTAPLFMRAGQPQTPERRGVGAQLIGYQQLRCETATNRNPPPKRHKELILPEELVRGWGPNFSPDSYDLQFRPP